MVVVYQCMFVRNSKSTASDISVRRWLSLAFWSSPNRYATVDNGHLIAWPYILILDKVFRLEELLGPFRYSFVVI